MARGSTIPGHILAIHLPLSMRKQGDGPLVHQEIYFKPKNSMATLAAQRTCPLAFMAVAKVDAMNFESEEDDLMDDDMTMDDGNGENMIQVDIGGHPPFSTGSKQFSGNFGNLLFLAGFNFRGHFEGLNEGFLRSMFSMIAKGMIELPK
jgi:hypothetical protein